jgi:hypothetical protein
MMGKIFVLPNVDYRRDLSKAIEGAPNFTYGEVVSSQIAVRKGIANIPSEAEWKRAEAMAKDILQPLRNKVGRINVNSWFRSKKLNDAVGSSDASFHRTGGGADLDPEEVSLMELLESAMKLPVSEVIAEYFPNGWVHIGYAVGSPRKALKLKDPKHHYAKMSLEQLKGYYHA